MTVLQEMQKFEITTISTELDKIDKDASDLIIQMLQKNPASRITLKKILKHKFVTSK